MVKKKIVKEDKMLNVKLPLWLIEKIESLKDYPSTARWKVIATAVIKLEGDNQ